MNTTKEFIPPKSDIKIIHPYEYKEVSGFTHLLVDIKSIEGHRFTSENQESRIIYEDFTISNSSAFQDSNSFLGVWPGDGKIYLAVVYAFEHEPFYLYPKSNNYIRIALVNNNKDDSNAEPF